MRLKFEKKNILIEGGNISYYICGNLNSNICLFFINGLYHGKEAWTKQQRYSPFYENFKMVFVDYRGAGNSEYLGSEFAFDDIISDFRKVVLAEKTEKSIFVGYSVGGLIAMYYSYLYQHEITGLVLLNTGVSFNAHATFILHEVVHFLDKGIPLKEILRFILPWNHSAQYLEKIKEFEEMIRESYSNYNENIISFKYFLKAIEYRPDMLFIPELITIPVLLIGGSNDYIFPIGFQNELFNKFPNISLHILDDCGHASFLEKDIEVNELIKCFIFDGLQCQGVRDVSAQKMMN